MSIPNFAVFILTHGRADRVVTYNTLRKQGYKVLLADDVRPDIIARKDGIVIAKEIEFGEPNYTKYEGIDFFDDVVWIIMDKRKYPTIHIYISQELKDKLRNYTKFKYGEHRFISMVACQALEEFLDRENKQPSMD